MGAVRVPSLCQCPALWKEASCREPPWPPSPDVGVLSREESPQLAHRELAGPTPPLLFLGGCQPSSDAQGWPGLAGSRSLAGSRGINSTGAALSPCPQARVASWPGELSPRDTSVKTMCACPVHLRVAPPRPAQAPEVILISWGDRRIPEGLGQG